MIIVDQLHRAGDGVHPHQVGAPLLEVFAVLGAGGVLVHEIEELQVALGVVDHPRPLLELEQVEVAVIVEYPFLEQLGALAFGQLEGGFLALVLRLLEPRELVDQRGFDVVRPRAVGATLQFVLLDTDRLPYLENFPPVITAHNPRVVLGIIRPGRQRLTQIETIAHRHQLVENQPACKLFFAASDSALRSVARALVLELTQSTPRVSPMKSSFLPIPARHGLATFVLLAVAVVAVSAASYNNKSIKGQFSFHLSAVSPAGLPDASGPQTVNRVGVMDFDGKDGQVIGQTVSVLDDGSETVVVEYRWTGTYEILDNGLGTLVVEAPAAAAIVSCADGAGQPLADCQQALGEETYRFVIVVGKKESSLSLIQTDGPAGDRRAFLRGLQGR